MLDFVKQKSNLLSAPYKRGWVSQNRHSIDIFLSLRNIFAKLVSFPLPAQRIFQAQSDLSSDSVKQSGEPLGIPLFIVVSCAAFACGLCFQVSNLTRRRRSRG